MSRGYWGLHMKNEDSLLQSTLKNSRQSIADNRNELRSTGPRLVLLLTTRCLSLGALRGHEEGGVYI